MGKYLKGQYIVNDDGCVVPVGTQLYELYLALQEFYTLGFSIIQKDKLSKGWVNESNQAT